MERLLHDLSINVTAMFRDPAFHAALRERRWSRCCAPIRSSGSGSPAARPARRSSRWRSRCARRGCSTARASTPPTSTTTVLARGRAGRFPLEQLQDYTAQLPARRGHGGVLAATTRSSGDAGGLRPGARARRRLRPAQPRLRRGRSTSSTLIVCRNVMIYFGRELQDRVLEPLRRRAWRRPACWRSAARRRCTARRSSSATSRSSTREALPETRHDALRAGRHRRVLGWPARRRARCLAGAARRTSTRRVLVVQHRAEDAAEPARRRCCARTCVADRARGRGQGRRSPRGDVLVAPPDYHLLVEDDHFALSIEAQVRFSRPVDRRGASSRAADALGARRGRRRADRRQRRRRRRAGRGAARAAARRSSRTPRGRARRGCRRRRSPRPQPQIVAGAGRDRGRARALARSPATTACRDERERPAVLLVDDRPENLLALGAVLEPLRCRLVSRRLGRGGAAALLAGRLRRRSCSTCRCRAWTASRRPSCIKRPRAHARRPDHLRHGDRQGAPPRLPRLRGRRGRLRLQALRPRASCAPRSASSSSWTRSRAPPRKRGDAARGLRLRRRSAWRASTSRAASPRSTARCARARSGASRADLARPAAGRARPPRGTADVVERTRARLLAGGDGPRPGVRGRAAAAGGDEVPCAVSFSLAHAAAAARTPWSSPRCRTCASAGGPRTSARSGSPRAVARARGRARVASACATIQRISDAALAHAGASTTSCASCCRARSRSSPSTPPRSCCTRPTTATVVVPGGRRACDERRADAAPASATARASVTARRSSRRRAGGGPSATAASVPLPSSTGRSDRRAARRHAVRPPLHARGRGPARARRRPRRAGDRARAALPARAPRSPRSCSAACCPRELPTVPGLATAAPLPPGAAPGSQVGGDWYDAVVQPDGRLLLVIGDVAGRGDRGGVDDGPAAQRAARLRARRARPPASLLERLNALPASACATAGDGDASCSAQRRPRHRRACASRTPATRRRSSWTPTGPASGSTAARGVPLGARRRRAYSEAPRRSSPGSMLVLYTDGLVEQRGESLDEGSSACRRPRSARRRRSGGCATRSSTARSPTRPPTTTSRCSCCG